MQQIAKAAVVYDVKAILKCIISCKHKACASAASTTGVGLYTIIANNIIILYGVPHPKEGPEGGRRLGSSRAIVLQSCVGNAGGGGGKMMMDSHT